MSNLEDEKLEAETAREIRFKNLPLKYFECTSGIWG